MDKFIEELKNLFQLQMKKCRKRKYIYTTNNYVAMFKVQLNYISTFIAKPSNWTKNQF